MTKREIARRRRQRAINRNFMYVVAVNLLIVVAVMLAIIVKSCGVSENNKSEGVSDTVVYESEIDNHITTSSPANAPEDTTTTPDTTQPEMFSRNLSDDDKYLLAKIAMAEAEGESIDTKIYVILTILNRVESKLNYFPDTIEEVIFQSRNGVYQFSPVMPGGRWWRVEHNAECWEAVEIVNCMEEDISMGALYFESCVGESWHSRNLEFLFKSDNMRFYK